MYGSGCNRSCSCASGSCYNKFNQLYKIFGEDHESLLANPCFGKYLRKLNGPKADTVDMLGGILMGVKDGNIYR